MELQQLGDDCVGIPEARQVSAIRSIVTGRTKECVELQLAERDLEQASCSGRSGGMQV